MNGFLKLFCLLSFNIFFHCTTTPTRLTQCLVVGSQHEHDWYVEQNDIKEENTEDKDVVFVSGEQAKNYSASGTQEESSQYRKKLHFYRLNWFFEPPIAKFLKLRSQIYEDNCAQYCNAELNYIAQDIDFDLTILKDNNNASHCNKTEYRNCSDYQSNTGLLLSFLFE